MLYPLTGSREPQPLVVKASVDMSSTGSTPTGTLSWNPSGPAVEVYELFVSSKTNETITIRFFYPGGKSIGFSFVWAGQSISYGTNMGVKVKLRSELDGLINSNLRSYAQAYDKQAAPIQSAISKLEQQFGLSGQSIVKYTPQATIDLTKAKVESAYASDIVFTSALANMVKANGNILFASNIISSPGERPSITIFTPYTWEKSPVVVNAATAPSQTSPKPDQRYGYILGPSIIETIERSTEWQPPQQTNVNVPADTPIPQPKTPESSQTPPSTSEVNTQINATQATSAPLGPSNSRSSPNMRLVGNEDGPKKQDLLNKEKQSKLTAQLFMCPALTGIKPHDIIFVPSLTGKYMEDWVVESTGYEQDGGKISVSIQATRPYGLGNAMQPTVAEQFKAYATGVGLLGPTATLEAWQRYAWPPSLR